MRARLSMSSFVLLAALLCPLPALAQQPAPELPASGAKPDPADAPAAPIAAPPEGKTASKKSPLEVPETTTIPIPPPSPLPPPPMEDEKPEGLAEGDHFEATMGFLAGQRSYQQTSFKFDSGDAAGIGGGGLVAPFNKVPFTSATVMGLRYDLRLVMSYIRMTVGFDLPFPTYKASDAQGTYTVGGAQRLVTVQSLSAKELRFGIGGEYPYKSIAPFVDLIGGVHWVSSDLSIDGYKATYAATSFAFSARGGLRAHVRKWFFAAVSGEVGLIGDIKWNAEVSVGFSVK